MAEQIVPPEGLNIISSYGSYHVGQIIACILCGITTMQVYLYFWNYYEHDKWYLKSLVAILWALDIVNLSLIIGGSWKIQVTNWGSIAQIEVAQVLAMDHSEVEAIIILVVQLYLIRRIWIFNRRKSTRDYIILCILPVLAIWQLVGDIVYQIIGLNKPLSVASSPIEVGLNISLRASAVFVDLAVTLYMVRLLTPQADAGFSKTRHMVYRTILVIVNTGMFTAIFAATTLILLAALPNDLWYLITELPLGTCYLTCFLANLNTRNFIRGPGDVVSIVDSTFHVTAPDSAHTVRLGAIGSVTTSSGPYDARSDQPFNNGIKITQVVESDAPELPDTIGRVNSITKTYLGSFYDLKFRPLAPDPAPPLLKLLNALVLSGLSSPS